MGAPNVYYFNEQTNLAYDTAGGSWYDWNKSGQLSPWEYNQLIEGGSGRLRNKDTAKGIWEKKFQSLYGFGFEDALNRQDEFTGWTGGEKGKGYVFFTPTQQKSSGGGGGGGGGPTETDIQALVKSLLLEDVKKTQSEDPGRLDVVSVKSKRDRERTPMKILSRTPPSALESIRAGARRAGLNLPM